ncbi:hypothetical protein TNCV_3759321 [Trichonephila clavipes]|nr:hypothetical protein TNCV_3759321 [Trichonephila clavipes]
MPLIEDLSRYGIEDCSYSPEAPKSNAYSSGQQRKLRGNRITDLNPITQITIAIMHYQDCLDRSSTCALEEPLAYNRV